jgi:hypothetical protein
VFGDHNVDDTGLIQSDGQPNGYNAPDEEAKASESDPKGSIKDYLSKGVGKVSKGVGKVMDKLSSPDGYETMKDDDTHHWGPTGLK